MTVSFGDALGLRYSPACIKIAAGSSVTFSGGFSTHPLRAGAVSGGSATPDASSPIAATDTGSAATFTFPNAGSYGYYCNAHFSAGMYGAIFVQ